MHQKLGSILTGVAFIAAGIGFAGEAFNLWEFTLFFAGWWTLFIIVPCAVSLGRQGVRATPVIGLIFGILLLLDAQGILPGNVMGKLLVPVVLVAVGARFLLQGKNRMS